MRWRRSERKADGGDDSRSNKNVIHEGTPHGNAELAQSQIIFMLSPIFFVINKSWPQWYYMWYAVGSTSGNGPKGSCLQCSVSTSKSLEDPHGFCRWLIGNEVLNNSSDNFLTWEIATNESPGVKSTSPRSITALSNVKPWLLWTVVTHASCIGNCVHVSALSLCFHRAVTGALGTQRPCSLS